MNNEEIRVEGEKQPEAPRACLADAVRRLWGVVASPVRTFGEIAEKPDWFFPLVVILAISMVSTFVFLARVDGEAFITAQMEESGVGGEQAEVAIKMGTVFFYLSPILVIIFTPVVLLILAAIFYVALKIVAGEHSFRQIFSVSVYTMLIPAIKGILAIPVLLFASDPNALDPENVLRSNLSLFLSDEAPKALYALAKSIDIFSIWAVVIFALGLGIASKRPAGSAVIVSFLWICWVAVLVLMVALFGSS